MTANPPTTVELILALSDVPNVERYRRRLEGLTDAKAEALLGSLLDSACRKPKQIRRADVGLRYTR